VSRQAVRSHVHVTVSRAFDASDEEVVLDQHLQRVHVHAGLAANLGKLQQDRRSPIDVVHRVWSGRRARLRCHVVMLSWNPPIATALT
jgi:hypothetical protein